MATTALRSVGRPRDPDVDRAILDATRDLLRELGYARLRIGEVAARAGVTPPTLRLRWPTKVELVHDALFQTLDDRPLDDTGTLEGDLEAAVRRTIALYTRPEVQAGLLGFVEDVRTKPELRRRIGQRIYRPAIDAYGEILQRAVERGEVASERVAHATTLLNTVAGAVLSTTVVYGGDLPLLERELVALLLDGLRADTSAPSTTNGRTSTRPARRTR